jgi:hypothetical protein
MADTQSNKTIEAYKLTFSGPHGNLVLSDLLQAYVLPPAFNPDSHKEAYLNGKRDLVLELLALAYENQDTASDYLVKMKQDLVLLNQLYGGKHIWQIQ